MKLILSFLFIFSSLVFNYATAKEVINLEEPTEEASIDEEDKESIAMKRKEKRKKNKDHKTPSDDEIFLDLDNDESDQ